MPWQSKITEQEVSDFDIVVAVATQKRPFEGHTRIFLEEKRGFKQFEDEEITIIEAIKGGFEDGKITLIELTYDAALISGSTAKTDGKEYKWEGKAISSTGDSTSQCGRNVRGLRIVIKELGQFDKQKVGHLRYTIVKSGAKQSIISKANEISDKIGREEITYRVLGTSIFSHEKGTVMNCASFGAEILRAGGISATSTNFLGLNTSASLRQSLPNS